MAGVNISKGAGWRMADAWYKAEIDLYDIAQFILIIVINTWIRISAIKIIFILHNI